MDRQRLYEVVGRIVIGSQAEDSMAMIIRTKEIAFSLLGAWDRIDQLESENEILQGLLDHEKDEKKNP